MAQEFSRVGRVAEQIRREIALALQHGIKDPRIGMVSISAVEVSRDLAYAKVFFTLLDSDEDPQIRAVSALLNKAAGFFRSHLAKTMKLRAIPQIRFIYDESVRRGNRLSSLIDSAIAEDERSQAQNQDAPEDKTPEQ